MAQLQFQKNDTSLWEEKYGNGSGSDSTISANTTDTPTKTTGSITSGSTSFTAASATGFSVGDLVVIYQTRNGSAGPGNWMLNKINNISGVNFTLKYAAVATFDTTCQIQKLVQYRTVTVNSTFSLTGSDYDGATGGILFLLASVSITGNFIAGRGYRGGVGQSGSGGFRASGEGTSGASAAQQAANGNGGGAGENGSGGGGNGSGGGGGYGTAGTDASEGASFNGKGGTVFGVANLTTAVFGGGGGAGGGGSSGAGKNGGAGAGDIFLFAPTVTATFNASGTNGVNGANLGGSDVAFGGGGGAGGSVLIKAQVATLGTTSTANGGVGGASTQSGTPHSGGTGGLGRIHLDYLTSYTGITTPSLDATQDNTLTTAAGSGGSAAILLLL